MTKNKDVIAWGFKNKKTGKIYIELVLTRKEARELATSDCKIIKVKIVEIKTK